MLQADLCGIEGRSREAENLYREVLKKQPDNVSTMSNLAVLLVLDGQRHAESTKWIDQATRTAGSLTNLLDSRAAVLIAQAKPKEALAEVNRMAKEGMSPGC